MHRLARGCGAALLMSVALTVVAAAAGAAQAPVPGAPCSAHGTAVVRLRLVDPQGRVLRVRANAVIIALRCGMMVDSNGVAELRGVPEGRYMVQVRAVGFPPESVEVAVAPGAAVHATVQLHPVAALRANAPPPPAPQH